MSTTESGAPSSNAEASGSTPKQGEFVGSLDCGTTSTRFIVFDSQARIVAQHQTEYPQITPHAGWHEQNPLDLIDSSRECIVTAVEKLEQAGWSRGSIKGIGQLLRPEMKCAADSKGITNQRETTICWSRSSGKPLCNAIVWDDARTVHVVRTYEQKLNEEGIDIDDDDLPVDAGSPSSIKPQSPPKDSGPDANVDMGTGNASAAFADKGLVVGLTDGVVGAVGKMMENFGMAGRGKEMLGKRKRKGKEGLLDV